MVDVKLFRRFRLWGMAACLAVAPMLAAAQADQAVLAQVKREQAPLLDTLKELCNIESGSLAARFTGENGVARGSVIAKTGWIDTAYSLGGVINAKDGTRLTFAFYAIGDVRDDAKLALDTLATAVYNCGDNLSNL